MLDVRLHELLAKVGVHAVADDGQGAAGDSLHAVRRAVADAGDRLLGTLCPLAALRVEQPLHDAAAQRDVLLRRRRLAQPLHEAAVVEAAPRHVLRVVPLKRVLHRGDRALLEDGVPKHQLRVDLLHAAPQPELLQLKVAARLQQLAHDAVRLRQVALQDQHAPAILPLLEADRRARHAGADHDDVPELRVCGVVVRGGHLQRCEDIIGSTHAGNFFVQEGWRDGRESGEGGTRLARVVRERGVVSSGRLICTLFYWMCEFGKQLLKKISGGRDAAGVAVLLLIRST
mmetsp:Transcript_46604/g.118934  ORF Transcript_46604/g.118934 Transcript_46604/m.118934 type:complete len:287 (-) Transcript_46604:87-947(-)